MTLEVTTEYSFKGHTYIRIKGDCYTSPRGWNVTLLTTEEFNNHPTKSVYRKVRKEDEFILNLHFS